MYNDKKEVRLELDFMQGPIWLTDVKTQKPQSGVKIVDEDPVVCKLNADIWNMYFDFYITNTSDGSVDFDEKKYNEHRIEFEDMIKKLIERLNIINDGSFYVVDNISDLL